jgi:hypothetical protein
MDAEIKEGRLTVSMECSKCGRPLTYSQALPPIESEEPSPDAMEAKGFCTHCGKTWSLKVNLRLKTSLDTEAPQKGDAAAARNAPATPDAREPGDVDAFYQEFSQSGGDRPAQAATQPRGRARWWRRVRSVGRR